MNSETVTKPMPAPRKRLKRAAKRVTMSLRNGLSERSPAWAKRLFGPSAQYLDMLLVDHGLLRVFYLNKHRLSGEAWRSAQPTPRQIRKLVRQGVRTILNLRGEIPSGGYFLERDTCEALGINFVNVKVRSRAAPSKEELADAIKALRTAEYPILMHCKSGADRAGLMSVLYRHVRQGEPIAKAVRELTWRYGHIRQSDTGVLDHFFNSYLSYNAKTPIDFLEWVETIYDAEAVEASFSAHGWANRLVNDILKRE